MSPRTDWSHPNIDTVVAEARASVSLDHDAQTQSALPSDMPIVTDDTMPGDSIDMVGRRETVRITNLDSGTQSARENALAYLCNQAVSIRMVHLYRITGGSCVCEFSDWWASGATPAEAITNCARAAGWGG